MIPANLIKTINGEPCILATIHDSYGQGLCVEYMKERFFPLDETPFNNGDKVWVKCYEDVEGWIIDQDVEGKAIIYPVEQEPEVSQEEKTWSENEVERLVEYLVPGMNSMVLISDFKQLTRKTTP